MPENPILDLNKVQQESEYNPSTAFTPLPVTAFQNPQIVTGNSGSTELIGTGLDALNSTIEKSKSKTGLPSFGGTNYYAVSDVKSDRYPNFLPGYDNEDIYGAGQGFFSKALNGTLKGTGIAATTFVNGTAGLIYGTAKALGDGRAASFYDNDFTRSLDEFNKKLENTLPNYYTARETNAKWYSPDNLLTANFLWDKLIKNTGFAVGAIGAGAAWGAAFKAIGLSAKLAQMGQALEASELAALESSLAAAPEAERTGVWLNGLKNITQKSIGNVLSKSDRILTAGFATFGEAGQEALGSMNEYRTNLIQEYKKQHNDEDPTGEDLVRINKYADQVGNTVFGMNTALLSLTNYIQFPKIIGSTFKGEKNLFNREINGIIQNSEGEFIQALPETRMGRVLYRAKNVAGLFASPSEAFEEGSQSAIQFGVQNYYNKAYKGKDTSFVQDMLGYGVRQALSTKEGLESILLGGLTGGLMEAHSAVSERGYTGFGGERAVNTNDAVEILNKTKRLKDYLVDQEDTINRGQNIQEERATAIRQGDILNSKDLETDFTHNYLQSRIKWGKYDSVLNDIQTYRTLAATEEGWQQLQQDGIVTTTDTRDSFLQRLNNIAEHAAFVNEHYEKLNNNYSGLVDRTTGERVYSDETIDKMVYAAAKINDYNKRLTTLNLENSIKIPDVIGYNELIAQTQQWAKSPNIVREQNMYDAADKVAQAIRDLDIPDADKDEIKQAVSDAMELNVRKQAYLQEYNDIKANPKDFLRDTVEAAQSDEDTNTFEIGDRLFNTDREYRTNTPVQQYQVVKVANQDKWEVKDPQGKVVDSFDNKEVAQKAANGLSVPLSNLDNITVLSRAGRDTIKIKDAQGKIRFVPASALSDHTLVQTEEELIQGSEEIKKNISDLGRELNNLSSGEATGNPADDFKLAQQLNPDSKLKSPEQALVTATTTPLPTKKDVDYNRSQRENSFHAALTFKSPEFRNKLKVIPITFNTQKSLGFDFIKSTYEKDENSGIKIDNVNDSIQGAIAQVYVLDKGNSIYVTLDKDGNELAEVGEANNQDPNQFVFTYLENAVQDRKGSAKFYTEGYTEDQIQDILEQGKARRTALFNSTDPLSEVRDFSISRGFPNYQKDENGKIVNQRNSVIDSGLLKQDSLDEKIWIDIPTVKLVDNNKPNYGEVLVNGKIERYPVGRPVLNRGTDVQFLDNTTLTSEQAENVYTAIKYAATKVFQGEKLPKNVLEYLSNTLYTGKDAPIYLEAGQINFGTILKITMSPSNIEENKAVILTYLQSLYHNVNNKTLNLDKSSGGKWNNYYEITGIKESGDLSFRVWKSYQHYLLSPVYDLAVNRDENSEQGKQRPSVPLTTKIKKTQEYKNTGINETPVIGRYITLNNYFDYVPQVKSVIEQVNIAQPIKEVVTQPEPTLPANTFVLPETDKLNGGEFVFDGNTFNTLTYKKGTEIVFVGSIEDGKLKIGVNKEESKFPVPGTADQADALVTAVFQDIVFPKQEPVTRQGLSDLDNKKSIIENNRIEELNSLPESGMFRATNKDIKVGDYVGATDKNGLVEEINIVTSGHRTGEIGTIRINGIYADARKFTAKWYRSELINSINAKYDKELAALENPAISKISDIEKIAELQRSYPIDIVEAFRNVADTTTELALEFWSNPQEYLQSRVNEGRTQFQADLDRWNVANGLQDDTKLTNSEINKIQEQQLQDYRDRLAQAATGTSDNTDIENFRRILDGENVNETINLPAFKSWMEENLPQFNINTVQNIIQATGGGWAWGAQHAKYIYLYENAPSGTEYHEAFEGVWNSFLSKPEQDVLYNEFRTREGNYIDRESGESINYKQATNHQVKEQLAEEFADFKINGTQYKGSPKKMGFFRRLWEFLKSLVSSNPVTQQELFNRINSSYYRNATFTGDATQTSYRIRTSGEEVSEAWLNDTLHLMTDLIIRRTIADGNLVALTEGKLKTSDIYNNLYQMVVNHYAGLAASGLLTQAEEMRLSLGEGGFKGSKYLLDNWKDFVEEHKSFIRPMGLVFKKSDASIDELNTQIREDANLPIEDSVAKEENKNGREYDRDIFTRDAKDSATRVIRLLFSTLTEQTYSAPVNSNLDTTSPVITSVGGRKLVDASKEYYRVLNSVSGSRDMSDAEEKVKELARTVPNLVPLVNRLFYKEPLFRTKDEMKSIAQLWGAMGLQEPTALVQLTNESGELFITASNNSRQVDQIMEKWSNNVKTLYREDGSGLVIKSTQDQTYVIDTQRIRNKVLDNDSAVKFLQEIAFPITKELYLKLTAQDKEKLYKEASAIYNFFKSQQHISTDKGASVNARFNTISELLIKIDGDYVNSARQNVEGTTVQNHVLPNYTSKINNYINLSQSKEDLISRKSYYGTDVYTRNSLLLAPDQWGSNGRKQAINNIVMEGARDSEGNAIPLSRATLPARLMMEINANLNGSYYSLIPADMKQEWGLNVGHYITEQDFKNDYQTPLHIIFRNYLLDEIALIQDKANRIGNVQVAANKNAEKLRFFKEILNPELRKQVEDLANTETSDEIINDFIQQNKVQIDSQVGTFIEQQVQEQKNFLLEYTILKQISDTGYKLEGIDTNFLDRMGLNKASLSEKEVEDILRFRSMNYVIHNIELHKVYLGDPAQYKDATKRIKSYMSGREAMYLGDQDFNRVMSDSYNHVGESVLKQGDPGYVNFSESFRGLTVDHDDKSTSVVSKQYANIYKNFYNHAISQGKTKEQATAIADKESNKYQNIEEADAQSWRISTSSIQYLMRSGGKITKDQESFFDYDNSYTRLALEKKGIYTYTDDKLKSYDENRIKNKPEQVSTFFIDKPIGSGVLDNNGVMESMLLKTSTMPLFYSMLPEGSSLQDMYVWMWQNGVDYVGPKSQQKVGQKIDIPALYNKATGRIDTEGLTEAVHPTKSEKTSVAYDMPWEHFGKQVETAGEHNHQTRISQLVALYKGDMFDRGVPIDTKEGQPSRIQEISDRNDQVLKELTQIGYKNTLSRLGLEEKDGEYQFQDINKFVDFLKEEISRREIDDNTLEAIGAEYNPATEQYELKTPLEALNKYQAIKSLIWSVADREIVRPQMNGGPKVQISAAMWEKNARQAVYQKDGNWNTVEDFNTLTPEEQKTVKLASSELAFYSLEEGGQQIQAMEVYLPNWFNKQLKQSKKYRNMSEEDIIQDLNSTEEGKKVLRGVGARIPVQGMNSIEVFVVKGFIPATLGDAIVVPSEITAKAGSDFDVDKLNTYLKNIYIDAQGDIKVVPFKGTGEKAMGYFRNLATAELLAKDVRPDADALNNLSDDDFVEDDTRAIELYKQSLENEYFQSLEDMILLPQNFTRLLSPNRTDELEEVGQEIDKKEGKRQLVGEKGNIRYSDLLSPQWMLNTRHIFQIMKDGVGIGASQTKLFTMLQSGDVKMEGTLKLPHNNVEKGEGDNKQSYISLSTMRDKEEMYISDKNSQVVNGAVDGAKNPWLANQLGYFDLLSTATFLSGAGVDRNHTYWFLRQPIIQDFMKEKSIQQALNSMNPTIPVQPDWQIKNKVFARYNLIQKQVDKATASVDQFKLEDLKSYIRPEGVNGLSDRDKTQQGLILNEFLTYQKRANDLFKLAQGVNWDTSRFSTGAMVNIKAAQYEQAKAAGIEGLDQIMGNTFYGEVRNNVTQVQKAFAPIFNLESERAASILQPVKDQYISKTMAKDKKIAIQDKIDLSFIDYLVQTQAQINGVSLNQYIYASLISDKNIATKYRDVVQTLKGDLLSNAALIKLTPVMRNHVQGTKNMGMVGKPNGAYEQNRLTTGFRELKRNPNTTSLYNNLVVAGILQSGTANSRISYNSFIPNEDYRIYYNQAMQALKNDATELDSFRDLNAFQRQNYRDNAIVPAVKKLSNGREDEEARMIIPYYINEELKNISDAGYSYITLPAKSREAQYNVVKVSDIAMKPGVNRKYLPEEIKVMKKNKDYSYIVTKLFQRSIDLNDNDVLYKQINAWGDGMNAQEYYTTNQPSVISTNERVREIEDRLIEEALYQSADNKSVEEQTRQAEDEYSNSGMLNTQELKDKLGFKKGCK